MGSGQQTRLDRLNGWYDKLNFMSEDVDFLSDDIRNLKTLIDAEIRRLKKPGGPGTKEYQRLAEANGQERIKGC